MNNLEIVIERLKSTSDKKTQIKILQEINMLLLTQYMLKIDDNFVLYPIEVEAYYYQENNFPDTCAHKYQWQQNRYGQLYFHRAGNKADASFLYDGGGIDVCLSNSDDFFLGILIRGAWINQEETPICTPGILTRRVVYHICDNNSVLKITDKERTIIQKLEENNQIVQLASNDRRNKDSILFQSTRFGINPNNHPEYALYKLRSLIELNEPNHPFRAKEKVVLDHMRDNNIAPIPDNIRKILGSNSNWIIEQMKSK
ncbi:hypothetical protein E2605_06570 [Dysgonomonas capnocytophagoides]|uniref:Uncharacterized protein n=1 Tax=Dysgonomonas capnocytophagoides TaxID=45254 RepID=A0A4Y8L4W2_9BACT|nr:hypothetical protein [Dysgonomonas capnocytophagoides]TFD97327.1 hypothetical protein E2605_06570 [Dysgonomonas capnocytophagoides]